MVGFSIFGSDTAFALNESMQLDYDLVAQFGLKHKGKTLLVFGFTYIIWQHFHEELTQLNKHLDLNHGILLHGGGWKNMEELSIDNSTFKKNTKTLTGISKVHNYYGMAEQTGSIFLECENGYLHSSNFSDIIVRRPDFSECEFMETGLIQVNSILPSSFDPITSHLRYIDMVREEQHQNEQNNNTPFSQRQLRVGELIKQSLGQIFLKDEAKVPILETKNITVTEVRMSPDLKNAKAYVIPLGGKDSKKTGAPPLFERGPRLGHGRGRLKGTAPPPTFGGPA